MRPDPRYDETPFIRLAECYVLSAIDQLTDADRLRLEGMGPRLCRIYSASGGWDDAIAAALHFPENMPELIRNMWVKNLKIAHEHDVVLTPQRFAEMFVDENLRDVI